jgi:hypothetical protein
MKKIDDLLFNNKPEVLAFVE